MLLTLKWTKKQGGVEKMYLNSLERSKLLYDIVDKSNGFYVTPVETKYRSRLNIRFQIGSEWGGNDRLTKEFLAGAAERKILEIIGPIMVGGIRVSMYNSITLNEAKVMAKYMTDFLDSHCV